MLAFGKAPQRFLISSDVKCAHFHGTAVAKPIPSYQVYKGTAFQLVDQAVDFVLSKIALSVGTRAESTQAPVSYEIPKEIEYTFPDKPRSRGQQYQLTDKGRDELANLKSGNAV